MKKRNQPNVVHVSCHCTEIDQEDVCRFGISCLLISTAVLVIALLFFSAGLLLLLLLRLLLLLSVCLSACLSLSAWTMFTWLSLTDLLLYLHLSLNRRSRWGTTDDLTTSFLNFLCPLELGKLQACPFHDVVFPPLPLSCLLPPFTVPCKMVLARPDERET